MREIDGPCAMPEIATTVCGLSRNDRLVVKILRCAQDDKTGRLEVKILRFAQDDNGGAQDDNGRGCET